MDKNNDLKLPDGFKIILPTAPKRIFKAMKNKLKHIWFGMKNFREPELNEPSNIGCDIKQF